MRLARYALTVLNNQHGRVIKPSWCTYLVCYRCNARCQMCDSWRMKPGDELTVDEVGVVFGKIGKLDVVRLSGGEPYLREDMLGIAETIRRQSDPAVIHITTNGSFPDRVEDFVRRFSKPGMLRFMVSFDGLDEEHDRNRGQQVTFAVAMETVKWLATEGRKFGVEVSANHTVITPQSLEDNAGIRERMAEYDVDVQSVIAYAESSMYGVKLRGKRADHMIVPKGYPIHPDLAEADVIGFVRREMDQVSRYRDYAIRTGKRYYLDGLLQRLEGREDASPNPKCVALRSHIRLLPDGRVPVCQFNTETVGNLLHQSFEEVWEGTDAVHSRNWVDNCPGCWVECEVMPNALYTGDLFNV